MRGCSPAQHRTSVCALAERKYQRVQQLAGLSGGVHTLRHTFASYFLRAQPDLFLLAKILGHSQTRVTEQYSHLLADHLERGRNAVSLTPEVGPATAEARKRAGGLPWS